MSKAERLKVRVDYCGMSNRRDEIDKEIRHLRRLESQLTDQKTLEGIKDLIADLETEKEALADKK